MNFFQLTVEDYVNIMDLLTNDVRFSLYNVCYKRVLVVWIFTAFIILLALLFSGLTGLTLFGLGVLWLVFNGAAIFICMWIKIKVSYLINDCTFYYYSRGTQNIFERRDLLKNNFVINMPFKVLSLQRNILRMAECVKCTGGKALCELCARTTI